MTTTSRLLRERGVLNDIQIMELCGGPTPMISPFVAGQVRCVEAEFGDPVLSDEVGREMVSNGSARRVISYGLSSYGYDIRAGGEFAVFDGIGGYEVDPKGFTEDNLRRMKALEDGDYIRIPPHSYVLCASLERFHMPDDVVGIAVGKSTYARCGIIANVTPLEPGWRGHLTIELSNSTPLPARVYAGEGVLQIQFWRGLRPGTTYGDRDGKYQDQAAGPVSARL